jgi:ATP-dependent DNA ligase
MTPPSSPFADLAAAAAAVGATRSKNAKRDLLAGYLRGLPPGDLAAACAFFAGRPLTDPTAKLGMGWVQQGAALTRASGADGERIRTAYLRHSDFGDAAAELLAGSTRTGNALTLSEVAGTFDAIAAAGSGEARIGLMADLFARANPEEARFIGRVSSRETRIGLREGLLEEAVAGLSDLGPLVIDGELVPWRQGTVLDFASLQTRLGRVRPSAELLTEVPVVLVAFDLLHHAGDDLIETPLRERRRRLEALALPDRSGERLLLAHLASARSADEVERHFDDARERRNEGLMIKDPGSTYQPGRRGLGWLKLKKALATLDCVVVGVEWGHGKRRDVLSDYTFAVRETDASDARLLTIGKAYTGLTDAEIATMTEHFKGITLQDFGRYRTVVPEVVVEIAFDRIMRSARHRSGFAMRFPRIVRMRDDKTPAEIDTMATVEALFGEQASGRILLATGSGGETERIAATGAAEDSEQAEPPR